jgi:hypothetical protein
MFTSYILVTSALADKMVINSNPAVACLVLLVANIPAIPREPVHEIAIIADE